MSRVKRFLNWFQVWFGLKETSKHFENFVWERSPEQPQSIEPNVQPPAVQIQTVRVVPARERAQFHRMRLELLPNEWLNSKPVDTDPFQVSQIPTQPVERDTEATLEVPALSKLLHERFER